MTMISTSPVVIPKEIEELKIFLAKNEGLKAIIDIKLKYKRIIRVSNGPMIFLLMFINLLIEFKSLIGRDYMIVLKKPSKKSGICRPKLTSIALS